MFCNAGNRYNFLGRLFAMKIGIVTLYDAFNYGSFLQAFALLNFFRDNDHDVRILDS
jgi:hypothetical protein